VNPDAIAPEIARQMAEQAGRAANSTTPQRQSDSIGPRTQRGPTTTITLNVSDCTPKLIMPHNNESL